MCASYESVQEIRASWLRWKHSDTRVFRYEFKIKYNLFTFHRNERHVLRSKLKVMYSCSARRTTPGSIPINHLSFMAGPGRWAGSGTWLRLSLRTCSSGVGRPARSEPHPGPVPRRCAPVVNNGENAVSARRKKMFMRQRRRLETECTHLTSPRMYVCGCIRSV